MPLIWTLDPKHFLMIAVANGEVTRSDVERYLDTIIGSNALAYRKVFDATDGTTSMNADDFLPLAVRMRSLHGLGGMGALAVILPPGRGERLKRMLGMLAVADRPIGIFNGPMLAYRWIAKQSVPTGENKPIEVGKYLNDDLRTRVPALHVRRMARTTGAEAKRTQLAALSNAAASSDVRVNSIERVTLARLSNANDDMLYRGQGEIVHQGVTLNICVKRVEDSWEFMCCGVGRSTFGKLMTLSGDEIANSLALGRDPLKTTIEQIRRQVQAGILPVPDCPNGAH